MSFTRAALITVPSILLLGILSGRLSSSGYGNPWFDALAKPELMPPGWLFGVAWTILYICLGLALALVLQARSGPRRTAAIGLFASQLLLNLAWSPLFFALHKVEAALFLILAILALSVGTTLLFARIRSGAALLMLPYLGWLCFAALLNYEILRLNPGAEALVPPSGSADIAL